MASSDGKPGSVFDHHVQTAVCDSRARYREGRRPRAVKVGRLRFPRVPRPPGGGGLGEEGLTGTPPQRGLSPREAPGPTGGQRCAPRRSAPSS
ncbi:hypothetical protein NN561_019875 [Cricetulus griseus]